MAVSSVRCKSLQLSFGRKVLAHLRQKVFSTKCFKSSSGYRDERKGDDNVGIKVFPKNLSGSMLFQA